MERTNPDCWTALPRLFPLSSNELLRLGDQQGRVLADNGTTALEQQKQAFTGRVLLIARGKLQSPPQWCGVRPDPIGDCGQRRTGVWWTSLNPC
jgi:hypothetical protein